MLPDTVLGLVVFAAGAGPGYLYVRLSQARQPRYERSALEEAAEFVVFGALSSGIAVLMALTIGEATNLLDTSKLAEDSTRYVATEPLRSLVSLALVVGISYGGVWLLTTKLLHPGVANISPGETAWYGVFHRMLPEDHGVYATVELHEAEPLPVSSSPTPRSRMTHEKSCSQDRSEARSGCGTRTATPRSSRTRSSSSMVET